MNEVIGNVASSNHCPYAHARLLGGVAVVMAMIGSASAAPTDATDEEHLSSAEGLSLSIGWATSGTAMSIGKGDQLDPGVVRRQLVRAGRSEQMQDILNQVNALSGQIDRVDARKVNTLLHDAQTRLASGRS